VCLVADTDPHGHLGSSGVQDQRPVARIQADTVGFASHPVRERPVHRDGRTAIAGPDQAVGPLDVRRELLANDGEFIPDDLVALGVDVTPASDDEAGDEQRRDCQREHVA